MEAIIKSIQPVELYEFYRYDEDNSSSNELVDLQYISNFIKDWKSMPLLPVKEAYNHKDYHAGYFLVLDKDMWFPGCGRGRSKYEFSCSKTITSAEFLEALQKGEKVRLIYGVAYYNGQEYWWHTRRGWVINPAEKAGWIIDGQIFVPGKKIV